MRKSALIIAAIVLIVSIFTLSAYVYADSTDTIRNQAFSECYSILCKKIIEKYSDVYSFDNFDYEIVSETRTSSSDIIDLNITVDMTLIQRPEESNLIKALDYAGALLSNEYHSEIEQLKDAKIAEVYELYYNIPDTTTFLYSIELTDNFTAYNLYERGYTYETNGQATPVYVIADFNTKINDNMDECIKEANSITNSIISNNNNYSINSINSIAYYRITARDYALTHCTDAPEFDASMSQSDCANFVSKCLNAGGFPTDSANSWYPSPYYGYYGYAGVNWIRTGYNGNGGVVPYMVDQGYFYLQTNTYYVYAGSILYRTDTSHVALVTYGDTYTIKYSQHSYVQLSEASAKNVVWSSITAPASFYMPNTLNVTVYDL